MSRKPERAVGTANGKVILLGEHAVVHGAPALALGIPLGVTIAAEEGPGPLELLIEPWGLASTVGDGTPPGAALAALIRELGVDGAGLSLKGESRLPARAGLGSSAAVATAAARAIVAHYELDPSTDDLFEAVQASERVFHGNPSGLDAAVAIGGGVIRFDRAAGVTPLEAEAPPLVVFHSGHDGDTLKTVARFSEKLDRSPDDADKRLTKIAALTRDGITAIEREDLQALGMAMNECQDHLSWFGVSTTELDRICAVAREAGALGAKLTGGGGGGCAVALTDPGGEAAIAAAAQSAGLQVVWP
jgi:mevalonate kinase